MSSFSEKVPRKASTASTLLGMMNTRSNEPSLGSNAQLGRLWSQDQDGQWRSCLYGVYAGSLLGKVSSSHKFQRIQKEHKYSKPPGSRPFSYPPDDSLGQGSSQWSSVVNSASETPVISECASPRQGTVISTDISMALHVSSDKPTTKQNVAKYGLDLTECDAVFPVSFHGKFVELGYGRLLACMSRVHVMLRVCMCVRVCVCVREKKRERAVCEAVCLSLPGLCVCVACPHLNQKRHKHLGIHRRRKSWSPASLWCSNRSRAAQMDGGHFGNHKQTRCD